MGALHSFLFLSQKPLGSHTHTFPLFTMGLWLTFSWLQGKGLPVWMEQLSNSRKSSSFPTLLHVSQCGLGWITTGLRKEDSGGGAPGMHCMCILQMLGWGDCPLIGFYPFSLVRLFQWEAGIWFFIKCVSGIFMMHCQQVTYITLSLGSWGSPNEEFWNLLNAPPMRYNI